MTQNAPSLSQPTTLGEFRIFVQSGGANPGGAYDYIGCLMLDSPKQDLGTPDPVYCPSPSKRGQWDIVGQIEKVQGLGTSDFTVHMSKDLSDIWWDLKKQGCNFDIQAVIGTCQRPDDFTAWEAKILFRNARLTNFQLPSMNPLSGDDNALADIQGSLTFWESIPIKPLVFSDKAEATVLAEILDGLINDTITCGDCGAPSDGCKRQYWLTLANAGSPGLSSQVVVTLNDGATYFTIDITPLAGGSAKRMAAVGNYLVVVRQSTPAHYFSTFNNVNLGLAVWGTQTGGYVASKGPNAIWSKSPSRTYLAAQGGYLYLMTNPTQAVSVLTDGSLTVQNLVDIHGYGSVVVAVGASNAIVYSKNDGKTFALLTGPNVGVALTAVWCLSQNSWIVGYADGKVYYTLNQGLTWALIGLDADVTAISRIYFDDSAIGAMTVIAGGLARVYRTTTSGQSWYYSAPDLSGPPVAARLNAVICCSSNKVAVGGLKSPGTDGIISVAS